MNARTDIKEPVKTMLRFPPDMHERMQEVARKKHRSLNNWVIVLVEEALKQEEEREPLAS